MPSGAIHKAPGDYPGGKQGDVLTVEFTVLGIPCFSLNGGPQFKPVGRPSWLRLERDVRGGLLAVGENASAQPSRPTA